MDTRNLSTVYVKAQSAYCNPSIPCALMRSSTSELTLFNLLHVKLHEACLQEFLQNYKLGYYIQCHQTITSLQKATEMPDSNPRFAQIHGLRGT